jgi:hypothetical protein
MNLFVRRLLPATISCVVELMMGMALVGEPQTYEWSTYAGSTGGIGFRDGPLGVAKVKAIVAVAADAQGTIYLTDTGNRVTRKISTVDSMVTTFAGYRKGWHSGQTATFMWRIQGTPGPTVWSVE